MAETIKSPKSWDRYFMDMLPLIASRSKDPNTKVGALIVNEKNNPVGMGYNGFPAGLHDWEWRWEKPEKYKWVVHAEMNAIFNSEQSVKGCTIYIPFWPCTECAKNIVASGIKRVVVGGDYYKSEIANQLFIGGGVKLVELN